MTKEIYEQIINEQIERCKKTLLKKGKEYATKDMLHNFKVAAKLEKCSMPEALCGMLAKHTISIFDMCKKPNAYTEEQWNEKVTDHINYLLILQAILHATRIKTKFEEYETDEEETPTIYYTSDKTQISAIKKDNYK
jgi:hypothetical protein